MNKFIHLHFIAKILINLNAFISEFCYSKFKFCMFADDYSRTMTFVIEQPLLLELRFNTKPISKQIALRNQGRSQIHSSKRSSLKDSRKYKASTIICTIVWNLQDKSLILWNLVQLTNAFWIYKNVRTCGCYRIKTSCNLKYFIFMCIKFVMILHTRKRI